MAASSWFLFHLGLSFVCLCLVTVVSSDVPNSIPSRHHHQNFSLTIRLPNVVSHKPDSLVCTGRKLDQQETYIVTFTPHASKDTAHHMMVYGCRRPGSFEESWLCHDGRDGGRICQGEEKPEIIFAWALDAPKKEFPKGVGLRVSGTTWKNYVVVQLHYARAFPDGVTDNSGVTLHMTHIRPPMQAGYYIMASEGTIAPQQPEVYVEAACWYNLNYTIYPIGFRTHSHNLGVVSSAYRVRGGKWEEIGRMSPQLPQTFYPVANPGMSIQAGDLVASRCTMNSMARTDTTHLGPTNHDEMCNFYIMYATSHQANLETQFCISRTPRFNWSVAMPEFAPFPQDASSLEGISNADQVRQKFNLNSKARG